MSPSCLKGVVLSLLSVLSLSVLAEADYAFRVRLAELHPRRVTADSAPVAADELSLAGGCTVSCETDSDVVRHAQADLADYLRRSMDVRVGETGPAIRIAVDPTLESLQSKITVTADGVRVTGATAREAMQGCYRLEDLLSARGRPALAQGSRTFTRMFAPRMTHSGWELEKFPDAYMDQLAHAGMDAILVFIADPPDVTRNGREDMNAIVERARVHGLDVYAYCAFPVKAAKNPCDPDAETWYDKTYGAIIRNAPGIKGLVCVGESVGFPVRDGTSAGYWWGRKGERQAGKALNGFYPTLEWVPWLELVTRVTRKYRPDLDVMFWTYNWYSRPAEARLALLEKIPTNITLHVTFAMGDTPEKKLGVDTWMWDYSITRPGPGTVFKSEAEVAKRRGIRLTSMANCGGRTWDVGCAPCHPVPDRWIARFRNIREAQERWGLCGLMDCHHYGFQPNFISEIAKSAFTRETDAAALDNQLRDIAARDFGRANVETVRAVWRDWSEAFQWHSAHHCDLAGPYRTGPVYPFVLPGGKRPLPLEPKFEYHDGERYGDGWKFLEPEYEMPADLLPAYIEMSRREIAAFERGCDRLRKVLPTVPAEKRAFADRMMANGAFHLATARTMLNAREFRLRGLSFVDPKTPAETREADRRELLKILARERENVRATLPVVDVDSALGWEPIMLYVCGRRQLEWKLRQLDDVERSLRATESFLLTDADAERQAREKLAQMTLEEKVSLCGLCATMYLNAIPRVGIDREWSFNDCGHCMKPEHNRDRWGYVEGADDKSTSMPCPSALASTWNVGLATRHGDVMGSQMRSRDKSQMLGPGINLIRNPLCGRNWEYMSEDPFVVARMVVPLVKAAQAHGLACTPKHFCLNNQEWNRFNSCSTVDDRTLHELYLPAFEAVVREAGVLSIMTAYNRYNGTYCSENSYLQKAVLRERWGFKGTIVTDWGGQHSCDNAVMNGGGLEANCGKGVTFLTDFYGTKGPDRFPLATAVKEGRVPVAAVDEMALRTLYVMAKTGFLSNRQDKGERLTDAHRQVAQAIGEEAIVLAKNDRGVLPLDRAATKRVVVFGEVATTEVAHRGSSCECHPPYEISFLKGLTEYLGKDVEITYFPLGGEAGGDKPMAIDSMLLETADTSGADAFAVRAWEFEHRRDGKVVRKGFERETRGRWDYDCSERQEGKMSLNDELTWSAKVRAPETGDFAFLAEQATYSQLSVSVDGKAVIDWRPGNARGLVHLEKGRMYQVTFNFRIGYGKNFCTFGWIPPSASRCSPPLVRAACDKADAVLVFTGTTMGFGQAKETEGKDRPNMLSAPGHDKAIADILSWKLPRTVVVCRTGSPIELPWLSACETMVVTSYLGQEAGRPMARTLFGEVNPSGKLTYSWPKRYADTPMAILGERTYNPTNCVYLEGVYVGYRWYEKRGIAVDFPFGHGLSYTRFAYGEAKVKAEGQGQDARWVVSVPVTNAGNRDGAEVVQLYVAAKNPAVDRPVKELKGFRKVFLGKGETAVVEFSVTSRDLAYYDAFASCFRADRGAYALLVGSSSADIRQKADIALASDRLFK